MRDLVTVHFEVCVWKFVENAVEGMTKFRLEMPSTMPTTWDPIALKKISGAFMNKESKWQWANAYISFIYTT